MEKELSPLKPDLQYSTLAPMLDERTFPPNRDDLSNQPLVSVVIPAYNAEPFIGHTLNSVLAQTYSALEVLVVDDGSQDGTAAVVRQYEMRDCRIRLLQQANAGVAAARNTGIQAATGELVAPLDADDLWYPHHVEEQVGCFLRSPASVGLVYSWSVDIDGQDSLTGGMRAAEIRGDVYKTLICHNFLGNASASMLRRSCLDLVGGYDTSLRARQGQGCEDWDLYLRIAEQFQFGVAPTFSVGYRKGHGSMSKNYGQMARSHGLVMDRVRQRHPGLPKFLFRLSASNLYFYFAHQSQQWADPQTALFWLRQAVQADPLTCWIHPELYPILVGKLGGVRLSKTVSPQALTLADIGQRHHSITRLLAKSNCFHWAISALARQPVEAPPSLNLTAGERAS